MRQPHPIPILYILLAACISASAIPTAPALAYSPSNQTLTSQEDTPSPIAKKAIKFSTAEMDYLRTKKQITMCVDPDWLPLEAIEDGRHIGMAAEYISIFQEKIQTPITLVPTTTWTQSLHYAKARKCDIFSLAMPTPERKLYMNFTEPYLYIPLVLAAKADKPFIDDITALTGSKLGVVAGYAFGEIIRNRFPELNIKDVDSIEQGLKYVQSGKIDGFIGTLATIGYSIQKNYPNELKVAGKFDERWELGIAARNDEPLLLSIFNKAISSVPQEKHQRILNHWISIKFVTVTDYTVLWRILPIAVLIVFFLLWRNFTLRKYSLKLAKQNKRIQEGEKRYRAIYNAPSDAIFVHDADSGTILDVNQGMLDMYGYNYDEVVNNDLKNFSSEIPPYTSVDANKKIKACVQHGQQAFKWTSKKKDGTLFWSEVSLKYTEFSGNRYVIAVVRDINDRIQADESLYFTKTAIDRFTDSAFWSKHDGRFIYVNDAACKSLGYSRSELMAMAVSDFDPNFPPEDWAKHWQNLKERGSVVVETTHRRKNGEIFPVEVVATFLQYEGKEFNCSFVRDISERKEAERNLTSEKERLAVTLRSIGDGVITTDIHGKIVLLNRVTENLTGWTNEKAVGSPLEEVFHIVNEQTREVCDNPVSKVIKTGKIIDFNEHTVLISKDGTERNIAHSGAPILDSESKVIGAILVFRDVTEQVKTEKELLKIKKLESIGILAGGIAHDFNNILAAILGNINLALFDTELSVNTKKLLSDAEKASIRAKNLTKQLLTFAKGGDPIKEVSSLATVIKDSAKFVLHGDKVACLFDIADDLRLVDADKGQIGQVIQNIVINASHAMPKGGVIKISCRNASANKPPKFSTSSASFFVEISIHDDGIGMAENIVEKIFDPYFTTKQKGSGLGLAICNSIINKHGGCISVESTPGAGTTFTIYLPAIADKKAPSAKNAQLTPQSVQARILIMDDDEMVRNVARAMLIKLGHEVTEAEDGARAVELFQDTMSCGKAFDLTIMDLTIPGGMGGKQAVQQVLEINPDAKVIVSSGYSNDPVMADFTDFGFCAAIIKPYKLQELSKVISDTLNNN